MKHTKEEIINALKVIKDECREQYGCNNCPFGNDAARCKVKGTSPIDWNIAELPPPQTWRALK